MKQWSLFSCRFLLWFSLLSCCLSWFLRSLSWFLSLSSGRFLCSLLSSSWFSCSSSWFGCSGSWFSSSSSWFSSSSSWFLRCSSGWFLLSSSSRFRVCFFICVWFCHFLISDSWFFLLFDFKFNRCFIRQNFRNNSCTDSFSSFS